MFIMCGKVESRFVVLDGLFLDKKDMVKSVESECKFKCLRCGSVYTSTVHKIVNRYEHTGVKFNELCVCGKHKDACNTSYSEVINGYEVLLNDYAKSGQTTTMYASTCICCGKKFMATSNTIIRRGNLYCCDCSKKKSIESKYLPLSELVEGIEDFWSSKNQLNPSEIRLRDSSRKKFITICPYCGKEVEKRYDAILRSGPYCGHCAKRVNVAEGNSLFEVYPVTAKKYDDACKNRLDSHHINFGSSGNYWFKCPKCKQLYYKNLQNQVRADCEDRLGCPVCQGVEVRKGINDVLTQSGYGSLYWDYSKNNVDPSTVYYNSREKYWFKCPEGHSFNMSLSKLNLACKENSDDNNGCPICSGKRLVKGANDVATVFKGDLSRWSENSKVKPEEVTVGSNKVMTAICVGCGKEYDTSVYNYTHDSVCFCEDCRKRSYSKAEKDIVSYIRELGFTVDENVDIGGHKSIDMLIKEKGIAIDYNGIYWHSTNIRPDINFHKDRIDKVKRVLGVRLYYIWEDDYKRNPEVIKSWLRNILGVNNDIKKVNARDCKIDYIDSREACSFLDKYHIQGKSPLSQSIGLLYNNGIVAVMAYSIEGNMINIKRYCTSCNVRGGFSKILKFFEREGYYEGAYTFSDNSISDGKLYEKNGFVLYKELKPDYSYVVGNKRVHKFNFRKKYFKEQSDLIYEEGLTERQLAILNGLNRVYDAGKKKWIKYF